MTAKVDKACFGTKEFSERSVICKKCSVYSKCATKRKLKYS